MWDEYLIAIYYCCLLLWVNVVVRIECNDKMTLRTTAMTSHHTQSHPFHPFPSSSLSSHTLSLSLSLPPSLSHPPVPLPSTITHVRSPGCVQLVSDTEEQADIDFEAIHALDKVGLLDFSIICPTPPVTGAVVVVRAYVHVYMYTYVSIIFRQAEKKVNVSHVGRGKRILWSRIILIFLSSPFPIIIPPSYKPSPALPPCHSLPPSLSPSYTPSLSTSLPPSHSLSPSPTLTDRPLLIRR